MAVVAAVDTAPAAVGGRVGDEGFLIPLNTCYCVEGLVFKQHFAKAKKQTLVKLSLRE